MSQGIHLLYNSEIEDLYRQNTASVLTRLQEIAIDNPTANLQEILTEAAILYGINIASEEEAQDQSSLVIESASEAIPESSLPEVSDDVSGSEEALHEDLDNEEVIHADITSSWSEDEEDDELLRDDPSTTVTESESPLIAEPAFVPAPVLESESESEPEPEPEEVVYDGPRFSLNAWGLPERVEEEGEETVKQERGPRRVVLEGIDE